MILFEAPCSPKIPRFSPPTTLALTTSPTLSIPKVQGSSSSLRQPESSLETKCRNGLCLVPLLSDGSGHLATLLDFRGLSFHCLSSLWQYLSFFLNNRSGTRSLTTAPCCLWPKAWDSGTNVPWLPVQYIPTNITYVTHGVRAEETPGRNLEERAFMCASW